MKITDLRIGMEVRHPNYGAGTVKALTEKIAKIDFDGSTIEVDPGLSELTPAQATAAIGGLEKPLADLITEIVDAAYAKIPVDDPNATVTGLGNRWRGGKLVLHPADPALQAKEVDLETFFHKIVMMRNNFRVLEQKVNGNKELSSADKFDIQQYITRCYGSMTTFNILFKDKDDYFSGQG
jgi:hypothetical protein